MGIDRFIKLKLKDTAVYWALASFGSDGSPVYSTPVEIVCLWVARIDNILDDKGREAISRATVYVNQDLTTHGRLYHGELTDLSTAEKTDPLTVSDAYEIMAFLKTPSLQKMDEYNRVVKLGDRQV